MEPSTWLAENDPLALLQFILDNPDQSNLTGTRSPRKLRLLACAICHGVWEQMASPASRRAVETVERYADGMVTAAEMKHAEALARIAAHCAPRDSGWSAAWLAAWSTTVNRDMFEGHFAHFLRRAQFLQLPVTIWIRDIFHNPFRPVTIDPAWLMWHDGTIHMLAQRIYEERAFSLLPVLATALTDAGCTNADILEHCRVETAHVRGCWVVDLLVGKS